MARQKKSKNPVMMKETRPYSEEVDQLVSSAQQLMRFNRDELAVEMLLKVQSLDPGHAEGLLVQAELEIKIGNKNSALQTLMAANYQLPDNPRVYWLLAELHNFFGHNRASISALLRYVSLKPKETEPMLLLSALYSAAGFNTHRDYWRNKFLITKPFKCNCLPLEKKLKVLVLKTAKSSEWYVNGKKFQAYTPEGHNNLESMLDDKYIERWRFFVDVLDDMPEVIRKLPKVDVIYNSITDPERCFSALIKAEKVCERLGKPVINHPKDVLGSSREENYARFRSDDTVILPKSVKLEGVTGECRTHVEKAIQQYSFELPAIVRLAGFQGGKYMHLVHDPQPHDFSELDEHTRKAPQTLYLIQYHEVGFHDDRVPDSTLYPKFRAFMVNNTLYPAHFLVVPDNFNVRRPPSNAFFEKHPWLKDERDHYLQDPEGYLPAGTWRALENAMQKVGLDYFGIDFACHYDADGKAKVVIFEANASMRNMLHDQGPEHPIYKAYFTMNLGVHQMLIERSKVEPWDYESSLLESEEARNAKN